MAADDAHCEVPLFDDIEGSYPPIDETTLSVQHRAFFATLPDAYREVLRSQNGGFLSEFRYTFATGVPYKTDKIDNPSGEDCLVELFGFKPISGERGPADLLDVTTEQRAAGILPADVVPIGRCVQSSLICISLRAADRGAIYYWDYYWRYPWCKSFFDERIRQAQEKLNTAPAHAENSDRLASSSVRDELRWALLVRLADDISSWHLSCFDANAEGSA
jgi:SMI1-KNR4 cell-wall